MGHVAIDDRFRSLIQEHEPVRQIGTGYIFTEGPLCHPLDQSLIFSDMPGDTRRQYVPGQGVREIAKPSNKGNGMTYDADLNLLICEHGTSSVVRMWPDGTREVLVTHFEGRELNSPNDIIVKSDGTIWFSDPHYGIMTDYEGFKSPQENACAVYCYDPTKESLTQVVTDMNCPNGLAFSPDESLLYVADTGRMFESDPQHIRVYPVNADNSVGAGTHFHTVDPGASDGFRLDVYGNIWSSAADGVHCVAPDGHLMGKILVPELVSNVCFGGRAKQELYITATTSVYRITLVTNGIQSP